MTAMALPTKFLFLLIQSESAGWAKASMRDEHPELNFAFSRPGLLTFKHRTSELDPKFVPKTSFARHFGFSLGQARTASEVAALISNLDEQARLHIIARDEGEGNPIASPEQLAIVREAILLNSPSKFFTTEEPHPGDLVIDVVVAPPAEPEEAWLIGWHRHDQRRSLLPGGVSRLKMNENAPSRAWLKLEELIRWAHLPIRAGQVAVEIGCAPGGAILSLIDRGLAVTGIDPGAIAPTLLSYIEQNSGKFTHLACPVAAVRRDQLPSKVDWLLCDANLAPTVTIRYLAYWSKQLRPALRGILFTLKLNDERMVLALPRLLARCGELGFGPPRAVQLPSHRREIAVVCSR